jgi:hypothetical protein
MVGLLFAWLVELKKAAPLLAKGTEAAGDLFHLFAPFHFFVRTRPLSQVLGVKVLGQTPSLGYFSTSFGDPRLILRPAARLSLTKRGEESADSLSRRARGNGCSMMLIICPLL